MKRRSVSGDVHLSPGNVLFLPLLDCEHLIRRMLVLDPSKRLSVAQIKQHKWMAPYVPVQRPVLHQQPLSVEGEAGIGEYSEQVLRLMHSLGIDQHKTIEVRPAANRVLQQIIGQNCLVCVVKGISVNFCKNVFCKEKPQCIIVTFALCFSPLDVTAGFLPVTVEQCV